MNSVQINHQVNPCKLGSDKGSIAAQLRWLANRMDEIATRMADHSADERWARHSGELAGAAIIARQWSSKIEAELKP